MALHDYEGNMSVLCKHVGDTVRVLGINYRPRTAMAYQPKVCSFYPEGPVEFPHFTLTGVMLGDGPLQLFHLTAASDVHIYYKIFPGVLPLITCTSLDVRNAAFAAAGAIKDIFRGMDVTTHANHARAVEFAKSCFVAASTRPDLDVAGRADTASFGKVVLVLSPLFVQQVRDLVEKKDESIVKVIQGRTQNRMVIPRPASASTSPSTSESNATATPRDAPLQVLPSTPGPGPVPEGWRAVRHIRKR